MGVSLMTRLAIKKNLMQVSTLAVLTTAIAGILSIGKAQAGVIDFDDLPGNVDWIQNGYKGFNWNNFAYLNSTNYFDPSAYRNGTVSNPNVAFNSGGDPASISINSGQFNFNSAYLTGAWNNGLNIRVEGLFQGSTKYSRTVNVGSTSPTLFNFNFLGIDNLRFTSFGGVNAGYNGSGTHFVLDNLTYNESESVPEPLTILGTLTAASIGVTLRCKQKQQKKAKTQA
ncbi:PEP-CTERM sorting domain-containing protein [Tolypothrix sp. LEGE 11397]|nr:PEP-CTERM putative exosortase interaction domain protein [Tolypothrix sp. PCC 7601]MBE9082039.1 PEP-CTERM sorting domain-containing protein [Tolypothrix sp. LEGE 11397]UYD24988.1 PEP-CTERM sorting domain-containing protein [Tolypothrix sp. PCC 7712]UYD32776.1 PEP-CTERM sorting domain-containing protein [Tolypothrix sp. PCC 7601]